MIPEKDFLMFSSRIEILLNVSFAIQVIFLKVKPISLPRLLTLK